MSTYLTQPEEGTCQTPQHKTTPSGVGGRGAFHLVFLLVVFLVIKPDTTHAQTQDSTLLSSSGLKKLSLEDLLNIEVTSVSMRAEKLTEVASAIQVITGADIQRSGVTRLPEALRLASNIQIAQANAHDWAITTRGFRGLPSAGGILANKLLVMIDGRSIYNPLFGGVYWDVQNTLLQDVDKIEVVSGPGGTLWGANAVNGVINIVTKSSRETQGLYFSGTTGSSINDAASVRIGARSKLDSNLYFRIYAQHFDEKSTFLQNNADARDAWNMTQGGFRMDYYPSASNTLTLQGDFYGGGENKDSLLRYTVTDGQNVLARFTHVFSEKSDLKIQAYYDRTWRITPNSIQPFFYSLHTYDFDIQHRFSVGDKQSILYGASYRLQQDRTATTFVPLSRDMPVYSAFIQDEIRLHSDQLKLTLGSKFLQNIYSGFEYQPCIRLSWLLKQNNNLWVSASRAVRTPTRFDEDITITDIKFQSEKVMAYELGYHLNPSGMVSLSFATFFNHYDHLRSLDQTSNPHVPIILANSQEAESWGFEFNGTSQITGWWRLRGGYTYFERNIWSTNPATLPVSVQFESMDPKNIFLIQSILDVTPHLAFDMTGRYVDVLPGGNGIPGNSSYYTCDARLAWHTKGLEIALVGQNLLDDTHSEVGQLKIPRTFYARIICQL